MWKEKAVPARMDDISDPSDKKSTTDAEPVICEAGDVHARLCDVDGKTSGIDAND